MKTLTGRLMLTQESRFVVQSDSGVSQLFLLGHASLAENDQLPALQRAQSRVRVSYTEGEGGMSAIAHRIEVWGS